MNRVGVDSEVFQIIFAPDFLSICKITTTFPENPSLKPMKIPQTLKTPPYKKMKKSQIKNS